ncbi:TRIM3-like protein [Mya arenaria]|uniref:TRIM3-like protein n=2 Tax=Mya arenaria TaxID=6604 RepID=A0ABY7E8G0_MYAAR|nr:TRIM3-like protein [Mya arenaria]
MANKPRLGEAGSVRHVQVLQNLLKRVNATDVLVLPGATGKSCSKNYYNTTAVAILQYFTQAACKLSRRRNENIQKNGAFVNHMAGRLASTLQAEYLSCSICLEPFRQPRALPCEHVFCCSCLVQHVDATHVRRRDHIEVSCPLCRNLVSIKARAEFDPHSWVVTLPSDSLIESLLATVNQHRGSAPRHPERLPRICDVHGGKPKEAYCFTHAQTICWECAARDHRMCEVDSSEKARDIVLPQIEALKEDVSKQLAKAREMSGSDKNFTETKTKTLYEILDMENALDQVYSSAKQQIAHLRADVEECTRHHLDARKDFYDVVTCLLEHNYVLDTLCGNTDTGHVLCALEKIRHEISEAKVDLTKVESAQNTDNHSMRFVRDAEMDAFLRMYTSVGFIDSNVPGHGDIQLEAQTQRDAPSSISHILKRAPLKPSAPPSQTPSTKTRLTNNQKSSVKTTSPGIQNSTKTTVSQTVPLPPKIISTPGSQTSSTKSTASGPQTSTSKPPGPLGQKTTAKTTVAWKKNAKK